MEREAIANRLVNYGDATAAFSIVNSLAFLVALAETEVRGSLVSRAPLVYIGLLSFAAVFISVVVWCHRAEGRTRSPIGPLPEDIRSLRRVFLIARIAVILLANVGSIPLVRLALGDSSCVTPAA